MWSLGKRYESATLSDDLRLMVQKEASGTVKLFEV
jgi:hypothetical protein